MFQTARTYSSGLGRRSRYFDTSLNNHPADRYNKNKATPDYLIYHDSSPTLHAWKHDLGQTQYEDLKILADPSNPKIPTNFELLYKSDKTSIVVYKINKDN